LTIAWVFLWDGKNRQNEEFFVPNAVHEISFTRYRRSQTEFCKLVSTSGTSQPPNERIKSRALPYDGTAVVDTTQP
jgi:hypothetical protein